MYILVNNERLISFSEIAQISFDDDGVYCRFSGENAAYIILGRYAGNENKRVFERITDWIVTNSLADKGIDSYKYKAIFTMPEY